MKNKILFVLLTGIFIFLTGCFGNTKEKLPKITCQIICDSTHILPKTKQEYALAFFKVTIHNVIKYPHSGKSPDDYEHILIIPDDTRAIVNGKTYFISVKKKFQNFAGKKFHKLPSNHIGKPDRINKGKFYNITAKDTSIIDSIINVLHNNSVFYKNKLEHAIKVMQFPENDANLRNYKVRQIFMKEYFIKNGQTITVNGTISGDTLFLLY